MALRSWFLVLTSAAAFVAASPGRTAFAEGSASGELGAGGTVTGDISKSAGEEDVIGLDLVSGSTIDLKLSSSFAAEVELRDAEGGDVTIPWTGTTLRTAVSVPVTTTGRYALRIRSADGTQGAYTLSVAPKWTTKFTVTGAMGEPILVELPKGGALKGKVTGGSWTPTIAGVAGPNGAQLVATEIAGKKGAVTLPTIVAAAAGVHRVSVGGAAPGGTYSALLSRKVPKVKATRLDLRNGLSVVGFQTGGVAALLDAKCASCHTWTATAGSFKSVARMALARVVSGQMPQGGPRLASEETALIRSWIESGMNQ